MNGDKDNVRITQNFMTMFYGIAWLKKQKDKPHQNHPVCCLEETGAVLGIEFLGLSQWLPIHNMHMQLGAKLRGTLSSEDFL